MLMNKEAYVYVEREPRYKKLIIIIIIIIIIANNNNNCK